MERKTYLKLAALFLLIIYSVGRIGLAIETYSAQFQNVTWLNLVITAALTFAFHQYFTKRFLITCFGIFAAGFLIEWIGVHTGALFGDYDYGKSLGWKLDEIPLLIGVNWLILIYCVVNFLNLFRLPLFLHVIFGAIIMILIDFFIEPFAIKFDLWHWKNTAVPIRNYLGWFVFSGIFVWFMKTSFHGKKVNLLAVFVLFLQLLFFASFYFST